MRRDVCDEGEPQERNEPTFSTYVFVLEDEDIGRRHEYRRDMNIYFRHRVFVIVTTTWGMSYA